MNPSDLPPETHFESALKCRTLEERAAYLDHACAGQPELRRRLEVLLAAHDASGEFLEPTVIVARPTIKLDLSSEEMSGTMIGRYKLLQKIGEGGMGVVYMAEQTEPVVRKVALKIIKLGMDTKAVVARFEAERQALALMDHPNIAKVLDAGTTGAPVAAGILPAVEPGFQPGGKGDGSFGVIEQSEVAGSASGRPGGRMPPSTAGETPAATLFAGRPYFVMELVHGVPITEYCDKNKLTTQQRLELFIPVCQAIQHAHQKGIIHRDIKPSNVMVTLHDGQPVPKVIDFGVAKATNQRLTEKTLFTHYAQMIGTPAYMSPEQAEMSGLDIDTRSDIYSLGVLLYELLTGTTPFDAKELLSKGYAEMQRIIAEQEPVKPSTRMSTLTDEQRTVVTTHRNTDASALRKVLQGDLDWIVMKCLEKDRTRRYETSNGLAADLRRHLNNELITARPPTTGYLLKKLIKRNKVAFATIGVVVGSLAVGFSVAVWSLGKEKLARRQAEKNFQMARRVVDQSLSKTARELEDHPQADQIRRKLQEDVVNYYQNFMAENLKDPALKFEVAKASALLAREYQLLGRFEEALAVAEKALVHYRELTRRHPENVEYGRAMVRAHLVAGAMDNDLGRLSVAMQHHQEALAICEDIWRKYPRDSENWVSLAGREVDVGNQFARAGQYGNSLTHMQRAWKLYQQYRQTFPQATNKSDAEAFIRHWLGNAYRGNNLLAEAEMEFRQTLALRRSAVQERPQNVSDQYDLAHILSTLADLLMQTGRPDQAEALLLESLAIQDKVIIAHPDRVDFILRQTADLRNVARVLRAMNRTADAEQHLRRALSLDREEEKQRGARFNGHLSLASDYYQLGLLLHSSGRREEAQTNFSRSFEILEARIVGHPQDVDARQTLAWRSLDSPVPPWRDPARALLVAEEIQRAQPDSTKVLLLLGVAQLRAGQAAAARSSLDRSIKLTGGGSPTQWLYLALASHLAGEPAAAREWYKQATDWIEKYRPADMDLRKLHREAGDLLSVSSASQ